LFLTFLRYLFNCLLYYSVYYVTKVQNRVAFGKALVQHNTIQQDIARSRIEIEQCRLLVLKSAYLMDTVGNKVINNHVKLGRVPRRALEIPSLKIFLKQKLKKSKLRSSKHFWTNIGDKLLEI